MDRCVVRRLPWMPVGRVSSLGPYGIRARAFTVLTLLFLSMPAFVLGMILVCLFAALPVALSDLAVDLVSTWLDPRVEYS